MSSLPHPATSLHMDPPAAGMLDNTGPRLGQLAERLQIQVWVSLRSVFRHCFGTRNWIDFPRTHWP